MSTEQFLGLIAAVLWAGGVAAPDSKDDLAFTTVMASGLFFGLSIIWWVM